MKKEVTFSRDNQKLQATLYGQAKAGVILCPPHPLYGGSRSDIRLVTIAEELAASNIASLAIDYSRYSGGREEIKDVLAAIAYFKQDVESMALLGYSYGTVIASHAVRQSPVAIKALVLVSPIKQTDDMEIDLSSDCPKLLTYGKADHFVVVDIEELYARCGGTKERLALETDHFYSGLEEQLARAIREFLSKIFFKNRERQAEQ